VKLAGDFFIIGPQIIEHFEEAWPTLASELKAIYYDAWLSYHTITGERLSGPMPLSRALAGSEGMGDKAQRHNRAKLIGALLAQAQRLGIEITYGKVAVQYSEDDATDKAAVVTEDGSKFEADVVVASDGLGTKSHALINGHDIRAHPSGVSVFRTAYPVDLALCDPMVKERFPLLDNGHPVYEVWRGCVELGRSLSFPLYENDIFANCTYRDGLSVRVFRTHDIITWNITHKVWSQIRKFLPVFYLSRIHRIRVQDPSLGTSRSTCRKRL
jgi:glycine/D-amino acid oxidase-like deaminating enzyme